MIPVVISGGIGSRLWPISRQDYPKQFCDLFGESLQLSTMKRLQNLGEPWVLTVKSLAVLTERLIKDHSLEIGETIYEPFGRNTAPAIAILCKKIALAGRQDEVVGVFPADHLVAVEDVFLNAVKLAAKVAESNKVVTLGIRPKYAATGYGYIELDKKQKIENQAGLDCYHALGFREKPSEEVAKEFMVKGNFYWNAGIFLFKASYMIELLKEHAADIWQAVDQWTGDENQLEEIYKNIRAESIDFAIMEKLSNLASVPCDIGWSDVGSWDELANIPGFSERSSAKTIEVDARNNFVYSTENKAVALIDVNDLYVVDMLDAVLISKKGSGQKVKQVLKKLEKTSPKAANEHVFSIRPWGKYIVVHEEENYKLKRITVKSGERLSYQSHKHRSENWIVVQGQALVTLNDQEHVLEVGESIFIPSGSKHRVANSGKIDLEFIEVQTGSYFGEDDITRYQDDYGRKK
ncbi:MAG: mannose-1-phosphate guanylyltransferase/mannose-6-phosphate isomerase [Bdellovibrionales bacterium]